MHPPSTPTHLDTAVDAGWTPWSPGIWLLRRVGAWGRALILLTVAILPALAWMERAVGPAALPRAAWVPLLVAAVYVWFCAHRVARPSAHSPKLLPPPDARARTPTPTQVDALVGGGPVIEAPSETSLESPSEALPPAVEAPADRPDPEPKNERHLPSELRVDHAQIGMAVDEIARRVVASSGLLDSCATTAQAALSDLEALQDEEQHAQKVLVALRARLMALEQRCNALVQTALATRNPGEQSLALAKLAQTAQAQVLNAHQLAERLGVTERSQGPRMASLRRNLEVAAAQAEAGLSEAQQLMLLTRRIDASLQSAGRRLEERCASAGDARTSAVRQAAGVPP